MQATSGCEPPGPNLGDDLPNDVLWESPHFEYFTRTGESNVCAPERTLLEENFDVWQTYLGFTWPSGQKVHYYKSNVALSTRNDSWSDFDIGSCQDGSRRDVRRLSDVHSSVLTLAELAAEKYFLDFPADSPTQQDILALQTPAVGQDCGTLAPLEIAADDYPAIDVWAPAGASVWIVRLRFAGPHLLSVWPVAAPGNTARITVCPDCDLTSPACQTTTSKQVDVLWNGDYVVQVQASDPNGPVPSEIVIEGR